MNHKIFIDELQKIGLTLTEKQLDQLDQYYQLLIEWNEKINLTAITNEEDVYLKHFFDSLSLVKIIDFNNIETLCDVGTGAGFPGIVLKIAFPNLNITLIDSLNKRTVFLNEVINKLQLNKIKVIDARAEEYAIVNRNKFDVVTARAVAPLNILLEICLPIVKIGKYFIAMKGDISQEIKECQNVIKMLNSKLEQTEEFLLPIENSRRTLIKVKKLGNTNPIYPRKYSTIKKKPLK